MKVKFFATYRHLTGCTAREVCAPATVGDLLHAFAEEYGDEMRRMLLSGAGDDLGPEAIILINGRNILHLGVLDAPLQEGDTVAVFPVVAGG
jgi:molybdopterin synthase sulfur carrier subunit